MAPDGPWTDSRPGTNALLLIFEQTAYRQRLCALLVRSSVREHLLRKVSGSREGRKRRRASGEAIHFRLDRVAKHRIIGHDVWSEASYNISVPA
jgi:hypothetical protein